MRDPRIAHAQRVIKLCAHIVNVACFISLPVFKPATEALHSFRVIGEFNLAKWLSHTIFQNNKNVLVHLRRIFDTNTPVELRVDISLARSDRKAKIPRHKTNFRPHQGGSKSISEVRNSIYIHGNRISIIRLYFYGMAIA